MAHMSLEELGRPDHISPNKKRFCEEAIIEFDVQLSRVKYFISNRAPQSVKVRVGGTLVDGKPWLDKQQGEEHLSPFTKDQNAVLLKLVGEGPTLVKLLQAEYQAASDKLKVVLGKVSADANAWSRELNLQLLPRRAKELVDINERWQKMQEKMEHAQKLLDEA